jgi:hypothetical protein
VLPLSFGLGVLTPRAKVKFNIGVSAADRPVDVPALFSLVYVVPPYDVSKKCFHKCNSIHNWMTRKKTRLKAAQSAIP